MATNLVLLAGLPGAGKSTFAKTFFDLKYAVVSSDAIREELAGSLRHAHNQDVRPWAEFYLRIADRLAHNVDVIADATFLTQRHRERAREVAEDTGAAIHLVLFTNHWAAEYRNAARDEATRVPPHVMEDMTLLLRDTARDIADEHYDTVTRIESFN